MPFCVFFFLNTACSTFPLLHVSTVIFTQQVNESKLSHYNNSPVYYLKKHNSQKHNSPSSVRQKKEKQKRHYLSPRVAVMVLVLVPHGKLLRVFFLNHFIGHFFTHSLKHKIIKTLKTHTPSQCMCVSSLITHQRTYSIYFIEDLPLLVGNSQLLCCLDGTSQLARPDFQVWQMVLFHKTLQSCRELKKNTWKMFMLENRHLDTKTEFMQWINSSTSSQDGSEICSFIAAGFHSHYLTGFMLENVRFQFVTWAFFFFTYIISACKSLFSCTRHYIKGLVQHLQVFYFIRPVSLRL